MLSWLSLLRAVQLVSLSMSDGVINKFIKIVAVLILLPLGVVIPTLSLESYYAPTTSAQTTTDEALEKRKAAYKADLKDELTSTQQQRIKLRCLAVQTKLKALNVRIDNFKTKRGSAYENVLTALNSLSAKLEERSYDTTSFDKNILILSTTIDEYTEAMKEYDQEIDDLIVIDCEQDPTAFKAALEAARADHVRLASLVSEIRQNITNTLKTQLQTIKADLEAEETTDTTNTTESTEGAQ